VRIMRLIACLVLVGAGVATLRANADDDVLISQEHMRQHIEFLASDDLAGRAPGTPGEKMAVAYLARTLKEMGCEPGNPNGSFTQAVPLFGFTVTNAPSLELKKTDGAAVRSLTSGSEFVGWTLRQGAGTTVKDVEIVFVGYGVEAPEYAWNDYKDVDVSGRIIVMLVNDPPLADSLRFGGRAMTYYGRWTYKFEKAAEKGAVGAVLVHTTGDAGYPWAVVENSWSGEQFDIVRPDQGESRCSFESWVTEDAARTMFAATGRSLDAARLQATSPDFRPYSIGLLGSVEVKLRSRTIASSNVVARLPGNDPDHADETIVYSAHWDHLGIGKPADGDSIYNGAVDNASGVAGVLEIARALAARRAELHRSVLFLFTTGEESGLLGSTYYTNQPLYPLEKTIAEINVDALNIWGRTEDMIVVGFGQSDLDRMLADANAPLQRRVEPDGEVEKGYYYRSDHFPFAKHGVPSLYSDSGVEHRGRPKGWGAERRREYVAQRYHKPQDEYDAAWDLSGAAEDMEALFRVGYLLATTDRTPQWSDQSEFKRVRDEMLRGHE
jgi:Zn-dependent M28 family amino/carboxypeptidase